MKFSSLLAACTLAATVSSHAMTPEPDVLVSSTGQHLVVNLPQTRVFLYQDGTLVNSYPVAVGKMVTNTPTGNYAITGIYRNPVWHVPKSIQEEMARAGKPVQTTVAAGPDNPLTARGDAETPALYLMVRHGVEARINRSTWLQLVELAQSLRSSTASNAPGRRRRWNLA